ncbi:hypothetical protein FJTKL_15439 [Diaporthe vaccinii]|uniref:Uncharacterized protein n=1 Tax=Diaporthe vaccinii TaxID=105482 RepID=A0ABR4E528_9PEZI
MGMSSIIEEQGNPGILQLVLNLFLGVLDLLVNVIIQVSPRRQPVVVPPVLQRLPYLLPEKIDLLVHVLRHGVLELAEPLGHGGSPQLWRMMMIETPVEFLVGQDWRHQLCLAAAAACPCPSSLVLWHSKSNLATVIVHLCAEADVTEMTAKIDETYGLGARAAAGTGRAHRMMVDWSWCLALDFNRPGVDAALHKIANCDVVKRSAVVYRLNPSRPDRDRHAVNTSESVCPAGFARRLCPSEDTRLVGAISCGGRARVKRTQRASWPVVKDEDHAAEIAAGRARTEDIPALATDDDDDDDSGIGSVVGDGDGEEECWDRNSGGFTVDLGDTGGGKREGEGAEAVDDIVDILPT